MSSIPASERSFHQQEYSTVSQLWQKNQSVKNVGTSRLCFNACATMHLDLVIGFVNKNGQWGHDVTLCSTQRSAPGKRGHCQPSSQGQHLHARGPSGAIVDGFKGLHILHTENSEQFQQLAQTRSYAFRWVFLFKCASWNALGYAPSECLKLFHDGGIVYALHKGAAHQ